MGGSKDGQEEEDPTFDQILIYTQSEEPHYDLLSQHPRVFVGYGVDSIPSLEDENVFLPDHQYLVVFDDMILEKDQDVIKSYYQRGRKKGISVIYQTQKFFDAKIKFMRENSSYFVLMKGVSIIIYVASCISNFLFI
jgi:hypothetical protein